MRLIDADKIMFELGGLNYIPLHDSIAIADYFMEQLRKMPTIAPPPNEPLTVDELREMDGEPVWWEDKYGRSEWGLVSVDPECVVIVIAHDQNFVAAVRGEMNIPFVVGIYRRKPDAKEDA